ncbi:hypothetical protein CPC08DRAFT_815556 [Agrocybe pediades]|nr:hypothetical protein CPC08DRAFT_815556 [Agrocybe pediades]
MSPYPANRKDDKGISSPVTPAVTGIDYPATDEASTELGESYIYRGTSRGLYNHRNVAGSSIEDVEPPVVDAKSLNLIWDTIRQEKAKKMAKERPKVQSLEEVAQDMYPVEHHMPEIESPPMSGPKSVKKQKSISTFRESSDGRSIVATFEIADISKKDIHISFQRNKLILTWEVSEITEWEEEDGSITRECQRNMYHRTLPLPEGTRYEEIHAQMSSKGLTLRYPNMRCYRIDPASRSGDS